MDACYEIFRATREADDPDVPVMPPRVFLGWLQAGWVGDPRETWLVEDAAGVGGLVPARAAAPGQRAPRLPRPRRCARERQRHGLGTALLRHAAGRAVGGGRQLLAGYAWAGSPGEAFARSSGATGGWRRSARARPGHRCPPAGAAGRAAGRGAAGVGRVLADQLGLADAGGVRGPGGRAQARGLYDAPHDPRREELGLGRGAGPRHRAAGAAARRAGVHRGGAPRRQRRAGRLYPGRGRARSCPSGGSRR